MATWDGYERSNCVTNCGPVGTPSVRDYVDYVKAAPGAYRLDCPWCGGVTLSLDREYTRCPNCAGPIRP